MRNEFFVKPISEIGFEAVNVFCDEQIEENSRLEYKKAFSSKDEKKQRYYNKGLFSI